VKRRKIDIGAGSGSTAEQRVFAWARGNRFEVRARADRAEIDLYDEIGTWGVNAKSFRTQLKSINAPLIALRINSPGGDVFDAAAIYNDLIDHPARVEVTVTGLAASAASIIAMAGDHVAIADNAFLMVHNAWTVAIGDTRALLDMAAVLEKIDGARAQVYAARSGLDLAAVRAMMDAETWLDAGDAVDKGLADEAIARVGEPQAAFDLTLYAKAPAAVRRGQATIPERGPPPRPACSDLAAAKAALDRLAASLGA
jgi:ATP-dependent protease ClpP protease subunit